MDIQTKSDAIKVLADMKAEQSDSQSQTAN